MENDSDSKVGHAIEAEKYIHLGLLLKKNRPEKLNKRILNITYSQESLDRKVEMILELDDIDRNIKETKIKRQKQKLVENQKPEKRKRRKREKPTVFVIDPNNGIYNLLQNSLLRKEIIFRSLSDGRADIDLINEVRPEVLIINQTQSLKQFVLEINQILKPGITVIILCRQRIGDSSRAPASRLIQFVQKPLNVGLLEETIRRLVCQ